MRCAAYAQGTTVDSGGAAGRHDAGARTCVLEKPEQAGSASGCRANVEPESYAPGPGPLMKVGAERSCVTSTS